MTYRINYGGYQIIHFKFNFRRNQTSNSNSNRMHWNGLLGLSAGQLWFCAFDFDEQDARSKTRRWLDIWPLQIGEIELSNRSNRKWQGCRFSDIISKQIYSCFHSIYFIFFSFLFFGFSEPFRCFEGLCSGDRMRAQRNSRLLLRQPVSTVAATTPLPMGNITIILITASRHPVSRQANQPVEPNEKLYFHLNLGT